MQRPLLAFLNALKYRDVSLRRKRFRRNLFAKEEFSALRLRDCWGKQNI